MKDECGSGGHEERAGCSSCRSQCLQEQRQAVDVMGDSAPWEASEGVPLAIFQTGPFLCG